MELPKLDWDSVSEQDTSRKPLPSGSYVMTVVGDRSSFDGDQHYVAYQLEVVDGPSAGYRGWFRFYLRHEKEFLVQKGLRCLKQLWNAIGVGTPSRTEEAINGIPFVARIALRGDWSNVESCSQVSAVVENADSPF